MNQSEQKQDLYTKNNIEVKNIWKKGLMIFGLSAVFLCIVLFYCQQNAMDTIVAKFRQQLAYDKVTMNYSEIVTSESVWWKFWSPRIYVIKGVNLYSGGTGNDVKLHIGDAEVFVDFLHRKMECRLPKKMLIKATRFGLRGIVQMDNIDLVEHPMFTLHFSNFKSMLMGKSHFGPDSWSLHFEGLRVRAGNDQAQDAKSKLTISNGLVTWKRIANVLLPIEKKPFSGVWNINFKMDNVKLNNFFANRKDNNATAKGYQESSGIYLNGSLYKYREDVVDNGVDSPSLLYQIDNIKVSQGSCSFVANGQGAMRKVPGQFLAVEFADVEVQCLSYKSCIKQITSAFNNVMNQNASQDAGLQEDKLADVGQSLEKIFGDGSGNIKVRYVKDKDSETINGMTFSEIIKAYGESS